jgi:hypothetical protein
MKVRLGFAARAGLVFVAVASAAACGDDGETPPLGGAGGAAVMAGSGAGGPAAGSGGGSGDLTCATANKTASPAMLHAAATMALLPTAANKGCAFSSCHDANSKKANLTLTETPADLRMQLVGKAACEVPTYQLVDTSGGDMALAKSWLWQKLTAPANSSGELTAKPEWGTAASGCGQMSGSGFGIRMPYSGTNMLLTPASKLEAIRDWICAGAPGPQ